MPRLTVICGCIARTVLPIISPSWHRLAERLGRRFEARAFWELVAVREPANPDAGPALARLATVGAARSATSGSLQRVLASDLGPVSATATPRSRRDTAA